MVVGHIHAGIAIMQYRSTLAKFTYATPLFRDLVEILNLNGVFKVHGV